MQTFLWCLWLTALSQCQPVSTATTTTERLTQSFAFASNGNITAYTRPAAAQSSNASDTDVGFDGLEWRPDQDFFAICPPIQLTRTRAHQLRRIQ